MALISTTYCTIHDVERKLSAYGVTAWSDHDDDGTRDVDVIEDAINQATEEMNAYLFEQYTESDLAGSTLVNRWCVTVSIYFLCSNRGNPIPDSIAREWERLMDPEEGILVRVKHGRYDIPRLNKRADMRPTWSNQRVDRRWYDSTVRVTKTNSSDAPTELTQDATRDYPAVFD